MKRINQLDLSAPMPAKSEDDIKTERILMAEMLETGAHDVVPSYLIEYRAKMIRDKSLKLLRKGKSDDDMENGREEWG